MSIRRAPALINFSIFFHPGHSYSSSSPPINYWGKFPTQKNFLKQYSYADFFAKRTTSLKERPRLYCVLFCNLCKEANTFCFVLYVSAKKPTYYQLLTSFRISKRMFVDVVLLNVFLDLIFFGWNWCVLLIIWILYCWSFVPLVAFCP